MNASAYTRILVIVLAAFALAACPGKKNKKHDDDGGATVPPPSPSYYVDASAGSDANAGTEILPFKTITHAMTVATTSGSTVHVKPGLYDTLNNFGESFPITVPAGVLLIGDEPSKGSGVTPTRIFGSGPAPVGSNGVTVVPGTGSTIAGLAVEHDSCCGNGSALLLSSSSVTLRNNTITGGSAAGVEFAGSTNHVISGNRIESNATGLWFSSGGVGSKVENNVITGNALVGVQYDVAGGDLGGGSAGSLGGNVITCNAMVDLLAGSPTALITISAAKNSWDHTAPSFFSPGSACTFGGDDICDYYGTATVNSSNATLALSPCL